MQILCNTAVQYYCNTCTIDCLDDRPSTHVSNGNQFKPRLIRKRSAAAKSGVPGEREAVEALDPAAAPLFQGGLLAPCSCSSAAAESLRASGETSEDPHPVPSTTPRLSLALLRASQRLSGLLRPLCTHALHVLRLGGRPWHPGGASSSIWLGRLLFRWRRPPMPCVHWQHHRLCGMRQVAVVVDKRYVEPPAAFPFSSPLSLARRSVFLLILPICRPFA